MKSRQLAMLLARNSATLTKAISPSNQSPTSAAARFFSTRSHKKSSFKLWINNVFRDASQGEFANRVPLTDENILSVFSLHDSLRTHLAKTNLEVGFDAIEAGGAHPQVDENFLRQSYTYTQNQMGLSAPNSPVRPLWRGANSFILQPAHREVLSWILTQLAYDTAQRPGGLRVKVFDSQGVLEEYVPTLEIIRELQKNTKFKITPEIAIPHSDGSVWSKEGKSNPYPREMFVAKVIDAQKLAKKMNFNPDEILVSLKNMIGNINEEEAYEITGEIMSAQIKNGFRPRLALHAHGEGELSMRALVGATKAAKEFGGEFFCDTVPGRGTGFVNTTNFLRTLHAEKLISSEVLNDLVLEALNEQDQLVNATLQSYAPARTPEFFTEADYIKYEIARGAGLSFINGVNASNLAGKLGLTLADTCHVVGHALLGFAEIAGHPLPVTPGMQNKQIAALHMVSRMDELGYFKGKYGNRAAIEEIARKPLSAEQIKVVFKGLDKVVASFLKGEMPMPMHPALREMFGRRTGLLCDNVESNLPEAKEIVTKLNDEGLIKVEPYHNESQSFHNNVARALILGPKNFEIIHRSADSQHGREIPPNIFNSSKEWSEAKSQLGTGNNAIIKAFANRGYLSGTAFFNNEEKTHAQIIIERMKNAESKTNVPGK